MIPERFVGREIGDNFVGHYPSNAIYHDLERGTYFQLLKLHAWQWSYGWLEKDGSRTSRREPGQPHEGAWTRGK